MNEEEQKKYLQRRFDSLNQEVKEADDAIRAHRDDPKKEVEDLRVTVRRLAKVKQEEVQVIAQDFEIKLDLREPRERRIRP